MCLNRKVENPDPQINYASKGQGSAGLTAENVTFKITPKVIKNLH